MRNSGKNEKQIQDEESVKQVVTPRGIAVTVGERVLIDDPHY